MDHFSTDLQHANEDDFRLEGGQRILYSSWASLSLNQFTLRQSTPMTEQESATIDPRCLRMLNEENVEVDGSNAQ